MKRINLELAGRDLGLHHPLKMRVPIEAYRLDGWEVPGVTAMHHPLKMRVPIEATMCLIEGHPKVALHHPLKMRVPIEAPPIPTSIRTAKASITL